MSKKQESMRVMFTREQSDKGAKLILTYPDGSESDHSLQVRSMLSPQYKKDSVEIHRKYADKELDEDSEEFETKVIELLSLLVIDWTFEEECTRQNVTTLLKEAPLIKDQISVFSVKATNFFKKPSGN